MPDGCFSMACELCSRQRKPIIQASFDKLNVVSGGGSRNNYF